MKRVALLLLLPLLAACSYIPKTTIDRRTAEPVDQISMGFWDDLTFWVFGIPYDRFRFTLKAIGDQPRWVAQIECRHISGGRSFMIIADGIPYVYTGKFAGRNTMTYDIPAADMQIFAKAERLVLRIDHGVRFDRAHLFDQQRDALRDLYAKHSN